MKLSSSGGQLDCDLEAEPVTVLETLLTSSSGLTVHHATSMAITAMRGVVLQCRAFGDAASQSRKWV